MAALFAGFVTPLLVTSARDEPALTAGGMALYGALAYLTTTKPATPVSATHEAMQLARAAPTAVATSRANRLTRLALGGVHVWAAAALASRDAALADVRTASAVGALALNCVGVAALSLLAVVWAGSGFLGQ